MSQSQLTASYLSPIATKTFTTDPLPQSSSNNSDVEAKTAYLSALRSNVSTLQGDINAFLTQKMEEDKVAEGGGDAKNSTADEREEDFYGEEDPGEEG